MHTGLIDTREKFTDHRRELIDIFQEHRFLVPDKS